MTAPCNHPAANESGTEVQVPAQDKPNLTVVTADASASSTATYREAVEATVIPTPNAIAETVVDEYLAHWDISTVYDLRAVEMELLGQVNSRISATNRGLQSGEKLSRMNAVTPRMAARVFCFLHLVREVVPSGVHVDDQEFDGLLCAYQRDGEFAGTYRRIDLGLLPEFITGINPAANEAWRKEMERKIRDIVPQVCETIERDLVMMADCIFNYETREFLDFTPEIVRLTKAAVRLPRTKPPLPKAVDQDGTVHTPESVLETMLPDPSVRQQVLESMCMAFRPFVRWNVAVLYYSPSGSNGKGTILDWIESMVGSRCVADVSPAQMAQRFGAGDLIGKAVNLVNEVDAGDFIEKAATMKQLITNDPISIELKYKNPQKVQLWVVNIWSVNDIPTTRDKTGSMFRRWVIVPFTNRFLGTKENKAIKDDYIKRDEWREYMAYKLLVEMPRFYKLSESGASTLAMEEHRLEMDPIFAFAHEVLPQFQSNVLPIPMLYATYLGWSKLKNPKGTPEKEGIFSKRIKQVAEEMGMWTTERAPSGKLKEYTVQNVFMGLEPVLFEYLGTPENERWLWQPRPHIAAGRNGLGPNVPRVAPALIRVRPVCAPPRSPDRYRARLELSLAGPPFPFRGSVQQLSGLSELETQLRRTAPTVITPSQ